MLAMAIDPAKLAEQLDAARGARDHLDRVIGWLEDGVAIFAGAPAPAELEQPADEAPADDTANAGGGSPSEEPAQLPAAVEPPPPAPNAPIRPARPGPPVRAGNRDLEGKVLGVIISSNRPLSQDEIITSVKSSKTLVRPVLQRLVRDGQVAATGATRGRRYAKIGQREFHTAMRTRQEATAQRNASKVQDGIDRVVFRDHVAKAIAADPGLTAEQLAQGLPAAIDDVTEACAWLVDHHEATRDEDGGHTRHTAGRARLRSAA